MVFCTSTGSAEQLAYAPSGKVHFAMRAQPLADALREYGRLTGLLVLTRSRLLEGRISEAVDGEYTPSDALVKLLSGTGLRVDIAQSGAVLIVPDAPDNVGRGDEAAITAQSIDGVVTQADLQYVAVVQTGVTGALCASPQARPGSYRLVVQLYLDHAGVVTRARMVGSTGLLARDEAIARTLHGLALEVAPPATLAQPVTILLRQHGPGVDTDCASFGGER